MKLLKPLPPGRTYEQLRNHYLVEKSIAESLKRADREERKVIFATMYEELFTKVPDHPRLTRRQSVQLTSSANDSKFPVVKNFLHESDVFVEFAPGDCRFVHEVAKEVACAYGVDISDQRNPTDSNPDNFRLIVYDGYNLDAVGSNSIDLVFSNHLIEHFHPEDTYHHFELVHRILKAGGRYVFRTPHALTGPHDVSKYFSYEAEGFHLKEWTYTEIGRMLLDMGYSGFHTYWNARDMMIRLPCACFSLCESILGTFPKRYVRGLANYLIPSLCGVAIK